MNFSGHINESLLSLPIIHPNWEGLPANVQAFSTTRAGGFSLAPYDNGLGGGGNNLGDHVGDDIKVVAQNREILNHFLPEDVRFLSQVHGTVVLDAATLIDTGVGDAVFTTEPNNVCGILTADCLPTIPCCP